MRAHRQCSLSNGLVGRASSTPTAFALRGAPWRCWNGHLFLAVELRRDRLRWMGGATLSPRVRRMGRMKRTGLCSPHHRCSAIRIRALGSANRRTAGGHLRDRLSANVVPGSRGRCGRVPSRIRRLTLLRRLGYEMRRCSDCCSCRGTRGGSGTHFGVGGHESSYTRSRV